MIKVRLREQFTVAEFVDLLLHPKTIDWNPEKDEESGIYYIAFTQDVPVKSKGKRKSHSEASAREESISTKRNCIASTSLGKETEDPGASTRKKNLVKKSQVQIPKADGVSPTAAPSLASTAGTSKLSKVCQTKEKVGGVLEVKPRGRLYIPQLGDDLVYFREGHEAYNKKVDSDKIYVVTDSHSRKFPYLKNPLLEPAVPVRVIKIRWESKSLHLARLKVVVTNWTTGEPTETIFRLRHHVIPGLPDFLVLRQIHDKYIRHVWDLGDRFRSLECQSWRVGRVTGVAPKPEPLAESQFLRYQVTWEDGVTGTISPWEMDIIPDGFGYAKDSPVLTSAQELQDYEASLSDWPPDGRLTAQFSKISRLIKQMMTYDVAKPFCTSFDLERWPDYGDRVEYPIDLSIIVARLDNRFYRSVDALKSDVKYIAKNIEKLNLPICEIVKMAMMVRNLCVEIIEGSLL